MQAEVLKVCDVRRSIPRRRRGTMHSLIVAHAHAQSQVIEVIEVIEAPQGCSWDEMGVFVGRG